MKWTYLSHVLSQETPLYGGKGEVVVRQTRSMAAGDTSNNTELQSPTHAGTHVDAPFHFDPEGDTLDAYGAGDWYASRVALVDHAAGPGVLLGMGQLGAVLERVPKRTEFLLIRTGAEKWRGFDPTLYCKHGVGLGGDVATWIRGHLNLKFIGLDAISVSSPMHREEGKRTHRILLGKSEFASAPILIVEDMALTHLQVAPKEVWVVPLRFVGADGGMVTVLARE